MTPIQSNKPLFFDADGSPLEGGKIYIGQPSTNPRTNPKTVTFRDSGGAEFTASQPLKTKAGRIVYNGRPIAALVSGEYSMLVINANNTEAEPYSPSVNAEGAAGSEIADFSELTRVGLTLEDIKVFDVSVGEVVENVGKVIATDKLGAQWLAISATGNPADDVDLIDFTNGLQGQRIKNQTYRKDIIQTGFFAFDDPEVVLFTSDADAYRSVWTNIDLSSVVPDNATSVTIRVGLSASYPSASIADSLSAIISLRKDGSALDGSLASGARVAVGQNRTNANDILSVDIAGEAVIASDFGSPTSVDLRIVVNDPTSGAENTNPDLMLAVVGYTINARDII